MKPAWALLAVALIIPAAVQARSRRHAALPRYGTFTYSDLCWGQESGDASGVRFALTRGPKGATLVYEYGNGPLQGARIKSLKVNGDRMEAEASTSDGDLGVAADLGVRSAKVSILFGYQKDGPAEVRALKRIKRFKQNIPICR